MGPAFFVIAILGCGEAEATCDQVRLLETRYESFAACSKATDDAVMRSMDVDYPVVVAQCAAEGARADQLRADEVDLPNPERNPHYPAMPQQPRGRG
jgi:hypothetical protein